MRSAGFTPGSSPRVRGTPRRTAQDIQQHGIIPACAGNTRSGRSVLGGQRDHPRVCGEHEYRSSSAFGIQGSSPRVRGTQHQGGRAPLRGGIIPACAGNTAYDKNAQDATGDHPRVCGEHGTMEWDVVRRTGSSPRVRGTRIRLASPPGGDGIIPACAGNTYDEEHGSRFSGDHPRVCGEHFDEQVARPVVPGSSPRVRGTQERRARDDRPEGIIPACAGNTLLADPAECGDRDHPRVCGEHGNPSVDRVLKAGSSPRVRGTPPWGIPRR